MKIDKEKLSALAALPDEELWATLTAIAKKNGINMPTRSPSHEELEKLRKAIENPDKLNALNALRIIGKYKKG